MSTSGAGEIVRVHFGDITSAKKTIPRVSMDDVIQELRTPLINFRGSCDALVGRISKGETTRKIVLLRDKEFIPLREQAGFERVLQNIAGFVAVGSSATSHLAVFSREMKLACLGITEAEISPFLEFGIAALVSGKARLYKKLPHDLEPYLLTPSTTS